MRKLLSLVTLVLLGAYPLFASELTGDYVESRNADVYTGYCFANSEAGLVGDQAIFGWHIAKGNWHGVPLDGLNVVAVVKARATLGDPYGQPYPARSILFVDDQASPAQRAALVDFARHTGGQLLAHVVRVETTPVAVEVRHDVHGIGLLRAGFQTTVQTRSLNEGDDICGNEETYYPPLTPLAHSMPAVAVTDQYRGNGLGVTWETHGKRSAFVGSFAVPSAGVTLAAAHAH